MATARALVVKALLIALLALGVSLLSTCLGGAAYQGGEPPVHCAGVQVLSAMARNVALVVRIIEVNRADPDQVVAELNAFADERAQTTDCLRALMPKINAELVSNPGVLSRYTKVVAPEIQKHDALQRAHPEIFAYPGVKAAIKRLL